MRAAVRFVKTYPLFTTALAWCTVLVLRPIWSAAYLPLMDWPQHLSVVAVMRHYADPSYGLQDYFVLAPKISTYVTFYRGASLLAHLMPVVTAGKVLLSAYLAGTLLAAVYFVRSLDRSPWPALLAVVPLYNWPFYLGFVHFNLSLPLLLLGLGLVLRLTDRATRGRWLALAALCALTFLTHALGYLIFGAIVLVCTPLFTRLRWRRIMLVYTAFIPSMLLFSLWAYGMFLAQHDGGGARAHFHGRGASQHQKAEYRPRKQKIKEIGRDFNEGLRGKADQDAASRWYRWLLWLSGLGALLFAWRRLRFQRHRQRAYIWRPLLMAGCAGALYFMLPMFYLNIWAISPRLVRVTALLAIAVIPPLFRREWTNALLFLPVLLLNVQSMGAIQRNFAAFHKETKGFDEVLAKIPRGSRVYGLVYYGGSSLFTDAVFLHFPVYAIVERGGTVGFTFFLNPSTPVRQRTPGQQPYPGLRGEWETRRWRYDIYWPYYEYLLVKPGYAGYWTGAPRGKLRQLIRRGQWGLYHNPAASKLRFRYGFLQQLHAATVTEERGGKRRPCKPLAGRHQCPHADRSWVGPTETTLGRTYMPAIWAHPVKDAKIRLSFDTASVVGNRLIGVLGLASTAGIGEPVALEIQVNGRPLTTLSSPRGSGYKPFDVTIPPELLPAKRIEFLVSAKSDGRRHFCFRAALFETK